MKSFNRARSKYCKVLSSAESHCSRNVLTLVLSMRFNKQHEHEAWSKGNCTALTLHKSKADLRLKAVQVFPAAHLYPKWTI